MKLYLFSALFAGILLAGCASGDNSNAGQEGTKMEGETKETETQKAPPERKAEAELKDTDNKKIGMVSFQEHGNQILIEAQLDGLESGHHGFHIHENGVCESDAPDGPFTTAGGHFSPGSSEHPDHAGDMPSLYANEDGQSEYSTLFDRVTMDQLSENQLAVVIHAGPDNFGNIPDRYQSAGKAGPDEETVKAGDAGDRVACGVITSIEP